MRTKERTKEDMAISVEHDGQLTTMTYNLRENDVTITQGPKVPSGNSKDYGVVIIPFEEFAKAAEEMNEFKVRNT